MRFDFHGLAFETAGVVIHLWSPWRASALEHRLFEACRNLPRVEVHEQADELSIEIKDPKTARGLVQATARVLKGWQEEAEQGSERRSWRWMLEGDTDDHGYDHTGEPFSVWCFIRVGIERGGPADEGEKAEVIDLDWFGLRILPAVPMN